MKGSPKPQIFVNLEIRISILIGNARKRIKQKVSQKRYKWFPFLYDGRLIFFNCVDMLTVTEETV